MKTGHPFDPRKGEPPYWLRQDPADMERHRKMVRDHARVHRRAQEKKEAGT